MKGNRVMRREKKEEGSARMISAKGGRRVVGRW